MESTTIESGVEGVAREQEFRRRWYEAHHSRFVADERQYRQSKAKTDQFHSSGAEALELVNDLARTGDLESFKKGTQKWAPTMIGFKGMIGQMTLNILVDRADEPERIARLLVESLTVPESDEEALAKVGALAEYAKTVKKGTTPALANVPFILSYFWGIANHERWPVIWPSGVSFVEFLTGTRLPSDPVERYRTFLEGVREVSTDNNEFEMTASWWDEVWPVFLDEVLMDRTALGFDQEAPIEERETNARALVSIAQNLGESLVEEVSAALERELEYRTPPLKWKQGRPRGDLWVEWSSAEVGRLDAEEPGLGVRIWVTNRGAAVGLTNRGALLLGKGETRKEVAAWYESADYPYVTDTQKAFDDYGVVARYESAGYPGCRVLALRPPSSNFGPPSSYLGEDGGLGGWILAEFVYGRWFEREQFAEVDLAATVVEVAELLKPLFEELLDGALGRSGEVPPPDDPLSPLIEEYLAESGYPTQDDEEHHSERREFAAMLAPEALFDLDSLRRIWNTGAYGGPGIMPQLNRSFNDASAAELQGMFDAIRYLCWGEELDAQRIDRMLDDDDLRIRGLGESVIMKLLAITHPETYIPVFPYVGYWGKEATIRALDLDAPTGSAGEMQVAANRSIRDRLERFFPDDPWGMSRFIVWYLERLYEPEIEDDRDVLGELADDLLIDPTFVHKVVDFLKTKRQVVFYGPPGTGKTYFARKLSEALAPDSNRRALVQFHPSSSYEDFFEGYRPEQGEGGELVYRLKPGPLALMAEKASKAPGRKHLMIIDEINRANLPKVLGELLFLLEYRDESVSTLYRPEDEFKLPENLWFIGTMNTADRSIALVDTALRRRFHFVHFSPNEEPVKGLLGRWLERHGEPSWVGALVARVNDELEKELGGSHVLLGPSYFMKRDLDKEAVRRIWEYDIKPSIEDQFFGDRDLINKFQFDRVYERYLESSGISDEAEAAEAPEAHNGADPDGDSLAASDSDAAGDSDPNGDSDPASDDDVAG